MTRMLSEGFGLGQGLQAGQFPYFGLRWPPTVSTGSLTVSAVVILFGLRFAAVTTGPYPVLLFWQRISVLPLKEDSRRAKRPGQPPFGTFRGLARKPSTGYPLLSPAVHAEGRLGCGVGLSKSQRASRLLDQRGRLSRRRSSRREDHS